MTPTPGAVEAPAARSGEPDLRDQQIQEAEAEHVMMPETVGRCSSRSSVIRAMLLPVSPAISPRNPLPV